MLPLLLDSAVRSLLLGSAVWACLKVARLRDTRTETAIWTAVLIAALAMPLLSQHVPGLVLPVPHPPGAHVPDVATAATTPTAAASASPTAGAGARATSTSIAIVTALAGAMASAPAAFFMAVWLLGFSVLAIRLAIGLLLTVRLYRRATPVEDAWVQARNIRISAELNSPVSLAGTILLPADYRDWSAAKRSAVLAHEEAHIARGDFFVQLGASIHCALFWFSPFAWWLRAKLSAIAETASDEAAIQRLNDRATYAEILVEVSRRSQKSPLIVAMAKTSVIQQRIEHILSEAPTRCLNLPQRMLSVAVLALLAIAVAGARAAVEPIAVAPLAAAARGASTGALTAAATATATSATTGAATGAKSPAARNSGQRALDSTPARIVRSAQDVNQVPESSSAAPDSAGHTYNPRALLDPVYTPRPNYVPAATIVHAGREYYIRSTEKPVTDVTDTYAMARRIH
jgi:beta-lactamase regulating signal transducer with metallopeptidase domain